MSGTTGTLEAAGAYLGAAREELQACTEASDWRRGSALCKVIDRVEAAMDELAYVARIDGEQAGEVA